MLDVGLPLDEPEGQGAQGGTHHQDEQLVWEQQVVGVEEGHRCRHRLHDDDVLSLRYGATQSNPFITNSVRHAL